MSTRDRTVSLLMVALLAAGADRVAGQQAPTACRDIGEDAARLACYDTAAARGPDPAPTAAAPSPSPPPSTSPPTAEQLFGRDAVESEAIVREASGIERTDSMESIITGLTATAHGKHVITLANGQVWTQTDTLKLRLQAGDRVTIRRAALGSYLLAVADGTRSIRVNRSH